jgi:hypothetical protein
VEAGRRLVELDEFFALQPLKVCDTDAGAAAKRCTVLLAAFGAVTVEYPYQEPHYFELNAAAEAAPANHRHLDLPVSGSS